MYLCLIQSQALYHGGDELALGDQVALGDNLHYGKAQERSVQRVTVSDTKVHG